MFIARVTGRWGFAQWGAIQWGGDSGTSGIQPLQNAFTDSITISDSLFAELLVQLITMLSDDMSGNWFETIQEQLDPRFVLIVDSLFFVESVAITLTRPDMGFTDFINLADNVQSLLSCATQLSDSIVLSDEVDTELNLTGVQFSDSVVLTDSVATQLNVNINTVLVDSIALSDAVDNEVSTDFNSYIRRYLNDVT